MIFSNCRFLWDTLCLAILKMQGSLCLLWYDVKFFLLFSFSARGGITSNARPIRNIIQSRLRERHFAESWLTFISTSFLLQLASKHMKVPHVWEMDYPGRQILYVWKKTYVPFALLVNTKRNLRLCVDWNECFNGCIAVLITQRCRPRMLKSFLSRNYISISVHLQTFTTVSFSRLLKKKWMQAVHLKLPINVR